MRCKVFDHILARLISLIVKLLLKTLRIETKGTAIKQSGVISFLHGEQLPLLLHRPRSKSLIAPISQSRDGDLQTLVMKSFGISAVRGSTSRGSVRVLKQLLSWYQREHGSILISLDGPRGPYASVAPGALYLANKLQVPLWFCYVDCRWAIRLKTWDHFLIPLPFSKVTIHTWQAPNNISQSHLTCKIRAFAKQEFI